MARNSSSSSSEKYIPPMPSRPVPTTKRGNKIGACTSELKCTNKFGALTVQSNQGATEGGKGGKAQRIIAPPMEEPQSQLFAWLDPSPPVPCQSDREKKSVTFKLWVHWEVGIGHVLQLDVACVSHCRWTRLNFMDWIGWPCVRIHCSSHVAKSTWH